MSVQAAEEKPMCNSKMNNVQYYTQDGVQGAVNYAGGMSGIFSTLVSLVVFIILFIIGYSSRGLDVLTITIGGFIVASIISIIWNYYIINQKPDGYTEDCVPNPNLN